MVVEVKTESDSSQRDRLTFEKVAGTLSDCHGVIFAHTNPVLLLLAPRAKKRGPRGSPRQFADRLRAGRAHEAYLLINADRRWHVPLEVLVFPDLDALRAFDSTRVLGGLAALAPLAPLIAERTAAGCAFQFDYDPHAVSGRGGGDVGFTARMRR